MNRAQLGDELGIQVSVAGETPEGEITDRERGGMDEGMNAWRKKRNSIIIVTWNWGRESDWCGGSGGACACSRNGHRGLPCRRGRASFRRGVDRCGRVCPEAECGWDRRIRRRDDRKKIEPPPIRIQSHR